MIKEQEILLFYSSLTIGLSFNNSTVILVTATQVTSGAINIPKNGMKKSNVKIIPDTAEHTLCFFKNIKLADVESLYLSRV